MSIYLLETTRMKVRRYIDDSKENWLSPGNCQMVGLVDKFVRLKSLLMSRRSPPSTTVISIVGMAGIGKTALTRQLYNDPLISKHFEYRAFVSVGPKYKLQQVIIDILVQVKKDLKIAHMRRKPIYELLEYIRIAVKGERYLLVMDDVWNDDFLESFVFLLNSARNGKILLTTRIETIGTSNAKYCTNFKMRFLNKEESWSLLCEKVFGKDSWCPFELVQVGRKIAEDCEGLPLSIIAIADLLAKGNKTLAYWKKVSEDENPLSIGTLDQHPMFDNVLYLSYNHLSQHLKACFLYMAVFPRRHEIVASKLIRLWIVEGFVEYQYEEVYDYTIIEQKGMKLLEELLSQSVVLGIELSSEDGIKTCKLHSVFWHMCVSEARKEHLFQVVNKYSSSFFAEVIKGHRRLCVHNNTLFGIKDAYNAMSAISDARSLLCTGPYHEYPVPMCFQMRLLKVLDALTIRFYEFPIQVLELVQLRYLAFTYDGMLHPSISQLWNLQFLIVQRRLSIVSPESPSYLPVEIWNMKELIHLQVPGALLPQPCTTDPILPHLSTILEINSLSLTAEVVNSIPNLKKLGIWIDSPTHHPFCFLSHLPSLHKLISLKCTVVNPQPKSHTVAPPAPSNILLPSSLKKLSLSGFNYPWKCMRDLGELRHLEVLKLRNYALYGREWEVDGSDYENLKVLLLEDLDLIHWRVTPPSLSSLDRLVIRHCYKLQEIPTELGDEHMKLIELVEVKPSVIASARNMVSREYKRLHRRIQLHVDCSCEDGT